MSARAVALVLTLLAAACATDHERGHRVACAHAASDRGMPACTRDADCGLCHDGSACGTVRRSDEIAQLGDACRRPDAALCECGTVHCCDQRCVLTAYCGGR
jgi:hypothetical protein